MDTIWISKVLITILLYFLLNIAYRKLDWHARKLNTRDSIIMAIIIFISSVPIIATIFVFAYIIILEKTFEYIDSRLYWEQIFLLYGFIALFFAIRIKFDEIKKAHENQINKQCEIINELHKEIKQLKSNKIED